MKGNYEGIVALATEVESIQKRKFDTISNSKDIEMSDNGESLFLKNHDWLDFNIKENAHQQIASKLDIPHKYYNKMQEIPGLRAKNVNAWLHKENGNKKHFIRTLDGNVRAFLSDRFKPVDNDLILASFLPVIKDMYLQVKSCGLTDKKMYIQVLFPGIEIEVVPGDAVRFGVTLSNSEVGRGAVTIKSLIWRLVCSNGMVAENLLHKYHVGRRVGEDISDYDIYQSDTIIAELESFKKRIRDIFIYCLKESYFQKLVEEKIRTAVNDEIKDLSNTVEKITKKYVFSEKEKEKIIMNMGKEAGRNSINNNRWHLSNSITALAHDIEDQEKQYEYEKTGWDILTLSKNQWKDISS